MTSGETLLTAGCALVLGLLLASRKNNNILLSVNDSLNGQLRRLTGEMNIWQESFALYLRRREAEDHVTGTRWRAIVATTPSGKSQWVCLCCGRASQTPDKTCPQGARVILGGEERNIPCTKDTRWTTH